MLGSIPTLALVCLVQYPPSPWYAWCYTHPRPGMLDAIPTLALDMLGAILTLALVFHASILLLCAMPTLLLECGVLCPPSPWYALFNAHPHPGMLGPMPSITLVCWVWWKPSPFMISRIVWPCKLVCYLSPIREESEIKLYRSRCMSAWKSFSSNLILEINDIWVKESFYFDTICITINTRLFEVRRFCPSTAVTCCWSSGCRHAWELVPNHTAGNQFQILRLGISSKACGFESVPDHAAGNLFQIIWLELDQLQIIQNWNTWIATRKREIKG